MAYAWLGFVVTPFGDVTATVNLIGNVVFALGAVVLLVPAYVVCADSDTKPAGSEVG